MPIFTRKTDQVEAYQLAGDPAVYNVVITWLRQYGYPRLDIDPVTGFVIPVRPGPEKGVYVDPLMGNLIIRTGRSTMVAHHNDWIVRYPADEVQPDRFSVMKPPSFERLYMEA